MQFLTCGGSHTIGLLSAVNEKARCHPTWTKHLADDDGFISKEKVLAVCGSLRGPLQHGFNMQIIRAEVELACPQLPWFIQDAMNKSHKNNQDTHPPLNSHPLIVVPLFSSFSPLVLVRR